MVAVRGFSSLGFIFALLLMAPTTLAQQPTTTAGCTTSWCLLTEARLARLEQIYTQLAQLVNYLASNPITASNTSEPSSTVSLTSTTTRYTTVTFGSASVTSSRVTKTPSSVLPIVEPPTAPPRISSTPASRSTSTIPPEPTVMPNKGYRTVAYFVNWGIYGRKYVPQNIPAEKLTHILYSFGDNRENGEVILTDPWSDTQIHYDGDSWNDQGNNLYGNMKQLNLLKKRNRNLKVLLSIGGWTYAHEQKHFDVPASTEQGRKNFANSCVKMIQDVGFDGIDLDWEYPQNSTQGQQLLLLLQEIRLAMDNYATKLSNGTSERPHFELSIAAPAGANNYRNMPLGAIANCVDFINLMAYDYSGSWDKDSGHQANLYASPNCSTCTPFNTENVIENYAFQGVPKSKLVLGMPLYGRAFTNTTGLGQPYSGVGEGSWENGVWDFKALPRPGAQEYYDETAGATYSYDSKTKTLVSYDTLAMALQKAQYIIKNGLGGAMWWELSGDRQDRGSLVVNVANTLGGPTGAGLEHKSNWLKYPDSQYENLRKGFPTN